MFFVKQIEPLVGMKLTSAERELSAPPSDADGEPKAGRLSFMNHVSPVVLPPMSKDEPGWIFQTYVDPDPEMEQAIRSLIEGVLGQRRLEQLATGDETCSALLAHNGTRSMLAEAYREAVNIPKLSWFDVANPLKRDREADRSRMNRTTLSLFSGPWLPRGFSHPLQQMISGHESSDELSSYVGEWAKNGWLLLGDAVLADRMLLNRLVNFFGAPEVSLPPRHPGVHSSPPWLRPQLKPAEPGRPGPSACRGRTCRCQNASQAPKR